MDGSATEIIYDKLGFHSVYKTPPILVFWVRKDGACGNGKRVQVIREVFAVFIRKIAFCCISSRYMSASVADPRVQVN